MKKFEVTLYYHTNCTVTVEAEDEDEALENAYAEVCNEEYTQQILGAFRKMTLRM